MRKLILGSFLSLFMQIAPLGAQTKMVKVKLVETSDIHGAYSSYDFRNGGVQQTGLSHISAYLADERRKYGDNLLLLDNGDILQGQPNVYYFNYIDTLSLHTTAKMMNYLRFDVGNMGNHDVETGHAVYDRWIKQCNFPILGANIIDVSKGTPYLPPYKIFVRDGVKIAVLGMITPAIPSWLPETLWSGLHFENMLDCARKWVPFIQKEEKPDLLIGLFHSGKNGGIEADYGAIEDASETVAREVPGFDVVFFGHDHALYSDTIVNTAGKTVYCLDPASEGKGLGTVEIDFSLKNGTVVSKVLKPELKNMRGYRNDDAFDALFSQKSKEVLAFIDQKIGRFENTLDVSRSFIGPSAFTSFINQMQMELTGAQISLSSPLDLSAVVPQGDISVRDMFRLYRFENYLYTMRLTGNEIKKELEMSYGLWVNQMKGPDDDLLLMNSNNRDDQHIGFKNFYFNFDSAAGIEYTVDVTKPIGERVEIKCMSDGTPFDLNKEYMVAVNSYRGNGGGNLLTTGAGISKSELPKRIVKSTDRDLRYYLIQYVTNKKVLNPQCSNNWKFIPEDWTKSAGERDLKRLLNKNNKNR